MRCEQIRPYVPGYAGADLRPDTARVVASHLASCDACRAELARHERVRAGLASLAATEIEPPAYLLDTLLEQSAERAGRRVLPLIPIPIAGAARALGEHRESITQAAGTALVAAGAAYALWRALRGRRVSPEPVAQ